MASSSSEHNIVINIEARNKAQGEINNVKSSMSSLGKETDQATGKFNDIAKASDNFGNRSANVLGKFSDGMGTVGQSLSNFGRNHRGMSLGAVAGFVDMAKTNSEYGKTIVGVTKMSDDQRFKTLDQKGANELVKQSVDELAQSYRNMSKQDIATQFLDISRAGYGLEDAMKVSDAGMQLATASGENLDDVTGILIRSMGAFGLGANDASEMARVLAGSANASTSNVTDMVPALNMVGATANASGISFEETANAIAYMHGKGVQASTGARGLRTMLVNMADASNDGTSALGELGFEMDENGLKFTSMEDMIGKYQNATANLTDEQKSQIAVQLGGKEAMASVLTLMDGANVAYDEHGNQIESTTGSYSDFSKEVDSFTQGDLEDLKNSMMEEDSWGTFVAQLENAKLALGEALAPSIEKVVGKLVEFLEKLQDPEFAQNVADMIEMGVKYLAFSQAVGTAGSVVQVLSGVIGGASSVMSVMGGITTLLKGGVVMLGGSAVTLGTIFTTLTGPIGIIVAGLVGLGVWIAKTWDVNESFGTNMRALWDSLMGFINNPIEAINNALQSFGDAMGKLKDKVTGGWKKIKEDFKNGGKSAKDDTGKMSKDVDTNTSKAMDSATKNSSGIGKGVDSGTKKASNSASKNTAKITTDVKKNLSEASNESMKQGAEIAKGLGQAMNKASVDVDNSIKKITATINAGTATWVTSFNTGMNNIGKGTTTQLNNLVMTFTNSMNRIKSVSRSGALNTSTSFVNGISPMRSGANAIAYNTANILYSTLGSINLFNTGHNVMMSFVRGLMSQLSSVAMVSNYASSLATPSSMFMDTNATQYLDTGNDVPLLSTIGVSAIGGISNPMGAYNSKLNVNTNTNAIKDDSNKDSGVTVIIHETFDGNKIVRTVNDSNHRSATRVKTIRHN